MNLESYRDGGYLELPNGRTYVRTQGSGPLVLVVHGGPGLDHSYLLGFANVLAPDRRAIFYDQIGCGQDANEPKDVTLAALVDQLACLLRSLSALGGADLVAHSWGAFVALSALQALDPADRPRRAVFLCPCPLTKDRNDVAGSRLTARLSPQTLEQIAGLSQDGSALAGSRIMELALPAYCGSATDLPEIQFSYSVEAYDATMESVSDYDVRDAVVALPSSTAVLYGERDFIEPKDSSELAASAALVETIPATGHFAFAERPDAVSAFMARALML